MWEGEGGEGSEIGTILIPREPPGRPRIGNYISLTHGSRGDLLGKTLFLNPLPTHSEAEFSERITQITWGFTRLKSVCFDGSRVMEVGIAT